MIKIAFCDDNPTILNELESFVDAIDSRQISCDCFTSGEELLKYKEQNNEDYQIYFLDIEMPEKDGIKTAASIRETDKRALLVFVTDHKDYVYQVFQVLPFRFLAKPVTIETFRTVLFECIDHLNTINELFFFKIEREHYQMPIDDILYFEGQGRKVRLCSRNIEYLFYDRISELEKRMNPLLFARIHASYLINMDAIRTITETVVTLTDDTVLPISRKYRKEVRQKHLDYMEWRCGS